MTFYGIMINHDDVKKIDIYELLIKLQDEVNDKLEYKIKLVVKVMNEIIPAPDEYHLYNKVDSSNLNMIKTDLEASNIILNISNNNFFHASVLFIINMIIYGLMI